MAVGERAVAKGSSAAETPLRGEGPNTSFMSRLPLLHVAVLLRRGSRSRCIESTPQFRSWHYVTELPLLHSDLTIVIN